MIVASRNTFSISEDRHCSCQTCTKVIDVSDHIEFTASLILKIWSQQIEKVSKYSRPTSVSRNTFNTAGRQKNNRGETAHRCRAQSHEHITQQALTIGKLLDQLGGAADALSSIMVVHKCRDTNVRHKLVGLSSINN